MTYIFLVIHFLVLTCMLKTSHLFVSSFISPSLHRNSVYRGDSFLASDSGSLDNVLERITVIGNITASLLNLVTLGQNFIEEIPDEILPKLQKVPGCISDVRLWAILSEINLPVKIYGHADSQVAQGILAIFGFGFHNMTAHNILQLKSSEIARRLDLQSIFPTGRLNGIQNILQLIQSQIRFQIETLRNDKSPLLIEYENNNNSSVSVNQLRELENMPNDPRRDEVAVLLSGGVDSSVSLQLLVNQGYKVRAYYLKIWLEDELSHLNECPWEDDLKYAQDVCQQLGVPLETVSLQKEYWNEVVKYTLEEAKVGRTPNPDIMCNSRIKFGMFYQYVGQFHKNVATGHYAQVIDIINNDNYDSHNPISSKNNDDLNSSLLPGIQSSQNRKVALKRSPDAIKDQTYFLCNLNQDQLSKALFPIGNLSKSQVRELADQFQLPTAQRKDSQGICFLGKLKFDDFIHHYLGENSGNIQCAHTGIVLGTHRGLWYHTVGQRKGLGLYLNPKFVHLGPWYVSGKNSNNNTLFVTRWVNKPEVMQSEFYVNRINWIAGSPPDDIFSKEGFRAMVQLRHGPTSKPGTLFITSSNEEDTSLTSHTQPSKVTGNTRMRIVLDVRDKIGIAEGQFAAFYRDDICLGAGTICEALPELEHQEDGNEGEGVVQSIPILTEDIVDVN